MHLCAYEPLSSYLLGYPEAPVAPKLNSTPDEKKFTFCVTLYNALLRQFGPSTITRGCARNGINN